MRPTADPCHQPPVDEVFVQRTMFGPEGVANSVAGATAQLKSLAAALAWQPVAKTLSWDRKGTAAKRARSGRDADMSPMSRISILSRSFSSSAVTEIGVI